jgi:hypothetical protein
MGSKNDGTNRGHESITRGERIRAAARTLRTPRTASWIADETDVSVQTAQKYLDQLVADNVLRKMDRGGQSVYCVDQLVATYREVATLQREHDREELTDSLASMRRDIASWKRTYTVETPDELRASIGDLDDPETIAERRDVASRWEHFNDRIPVIQAALNHYEWAVERDHLST